MAARNSGSVVRLRWQRPGLVTTSRTTLASAMLDNMLWSIATVSSCSSSSCAPLKFIDITEYTVSAHRGVFVDLC